MANESANFHLNLCFIDIIWFASDRHLIRFGAFSLNDKKIISDDLDGQKFAGDSEVKNKKSPLARRLTMKIHPVLALAIAIGTTPGPVFAGNESENTPWQFETTAEQANRAYLEDMRMKRVSGFYSSPTYNTTIGSQYNCNVNANSSGNGGSNSAGANTATATGPSGVATGNQASSNFNPATSGFDAVLNSGQDNAGPVYSSALGDVGTSASGNNSYQALNTTQQNAGTQLATVDSSNACAFTGMAKASH